MIAALFWKRSTKWGALAATLFVAATLIGFAFLQKSPPPPTPPAKPDVAAQVKSTPNTPEASAPVKATPPAKPKEDIIWKIGEGADAVKILSRAPNGDVRFMNNYMTVVPMVVGSAFFMVLFSLLTRPPSRQTIDRYFSRTTTSAQQPVATQV